MQTLESTPALNVSSKRLTTSQWQLIVLANLGGAAMPLNLVFRAFSGTTPLIGTWRITRLDTPVAPAWFTVAYALLTALILAHVGKPGLVGQASHTTRVLPEIT